MSSHIFPRPVYYGMGQSYHKAGDRKKHTDMT
jgi:hypothetical protein